MHAQTIDAQTVVGDHSQVKEMVLATWGHPFEPQPPTITGPWRCTHFNEGAIAQFKLNSGAVKRLIGRQRNHRFQIILCAHRWWWGWCGLRPVGFRLRCRCWFIDVER